MTIVINMNLLASKHSDACMTLDVLVRLRFPSETKYLHNTGNGRRQYCEVLSILLVRLYVFYPSDLFV